MQAQKMLDFLFEAMNGRSFTILEEILSDDVTFHFPQIDPIVGKKESDTFSFALELSKLQ